MLIGIIASSRNSSVTPPVPTNPLAEVATGEYAIGFVNQSGDVYTPVGNDLGYSNVKVGNLAKIIQTEGGQYNTLFRDVDKIPYSLIGNSSTAVAYDQDVDNQPFTCDYVHGLYKNVLALKDGELWYWCTNHPGNYAPEDILNQGYSGVKPKKLIQPAGKILTKVVSGSATTYGALTYALCLASDGTIWRWDRSNTTPIQVTGGWTGKVRDIAVVGPHAFVVETDAGQLWGWGYNGSYVGAQDAWQNPNPQNITSLWTSAGVVFPSKQLATTYNTLHIIDANNNVFASGSNAQGNIGNGEQKVSWRAFTTPYLWDLGNGQNMVSPVALGFKLKRIVSNNTVAFYLYAQDMENVWYSWGRNKARVLGNGVAMKIYDETYYSEYYNVPAPRIVTPLSTSWTVMPDVDPDADRNPIANAGVNQYLSSGTTSVTLDAKGSHQQQPTNSVTVTKSYLWTLVSGPNVPIIVSPTGENTVVNSLINGEYVFKVTVNSSNGKSDEHTVKIKIG